ncbi:MAG: cytochrome d ubiquinol oxidase subunit II [Planctomycetota bacterium]
MSDPHLVFVIMGLVLLAYALTGGADLGGGILALLARGPHAEAERRAITRAIGPIWEANHVWLIVLVVLMFTVFPRAFAALGIALHIPITLALVGLVLRGTAFVFGAYGLGDDGERARWVRVFAWASAATPLCLGSVLAAVASGEVRVRDGEVVSGYLAGWSSPFGLATGLLAVATFALTAAAYLSADAGPEVRPRFARHTRTAQAIVVTLALATGLAARHDAPAFVASMRASPWMPALLASAAAAALVVWLTAGRARTHLTRAAVVLEVTCLVLGYGLGMDAHLLRPDLHVGNAGSHPRTVAALVPVLAFGTVLLAPSLWYLLAVFRGERARREAAAEAEAEAPRRTPDDRPGRETCAADPRDGRGSSH